MDFQIKHTTEYLYHGPSAEAYIETRLTPQPSGRQEIVGHKIEVDPAVTLSAFEDYYGNEVQFFSLPYRHAALKIVNHLQVSTTEETLPHSSLETSIQETRQIYGSVMTDVYDFVLPTVNVPIGRDSTTWARRYLRGDRPLGEGLLALNEAIHKTFTYTSGSTTISTPLEVVWKQKRGVCQDFAHVMLSILRTAGLPSRYICGYLDPNPVTTGGRSARLTGSIATHAWVEVLAPGMIWVALDPTNKMWCGQRHVTVSYGRDFQDAAPIRGTFKGSGSQRMKIRVQMKRSAEKKS